MMPWGQLSEQIEKPVFKDFAKNKITVSAVALLTAISATTAAWATIDNTVTATGSSPGNTDDVTANDTETVSVDAADPQVVVTKLATRIQRSGTGSFVAIPDPDTIDAAEGDIIEYTYTFLNDGNVTITNVNYSDSHEGNGTLVEQDDEALTDNAPLNGSGDASGDSTDVVAANGTWSSLAPGDLVTFTSQYTVVANDINDNGGGDGDLDNTVTFSATPAAGTIDPADLTVDESVDLEAQDATMTIAKLATLLNGGAFDPDASAVVVGDVITYQYTVTNTGNVNLTDVSLADDITSNVGATDPTPIFSSLTNTSGNSDNLDGDDIIDILAPGDVAIFTATYTVTQADVDLQ